MLPPFSGVDLVRVMRAELDDEHRKAESHLPFESTEDFVEERKRSEHAQEHVGGLRRLLQFATFSPGRTKT